MSMRAVDADLPGLDNEQPASLHMWGWFKAEAARASRLSRARASGSSARGSGRNLTATCQPRVRSSAR